MNGMNSLGNRVWATATCALILVTGVGPAQAADVPQASDFAWRATLSVPPGASMARVDVPVQALLGMRSSAAHDVRVFNAAGAVVPFAISPINEPSFSSAPMSANRSWVISIRSPNLYFSGRYAPEIPI